MDAGSYIPSGQGPLGFILDQWISHKLGVQTQADQQLKDALDKQAKQQRDEDWRSFEHQSTLYTNLQKEGWTPMERQTGDASPDRPSILQNRTTTNGMQQPPEGARIIADPYGVHWWKVEEPKGALTDNEALARGGEPLNAQGQVYLGTLPPTSGLPAETLNVTPPAERVARTQSGSRLYIPTEEAQQAAKGRAERQTLQDRLQIEAQNRAPHYQSEGLTSPVLIDPNTGKATAVQLPEGVTVKDKPSKTTYHYQTDENGVLSRFPNEDDGEPQQWNGKQWVTAPKVVGREYTAARADAQQRLQDAQEARDQRRRDRVQKTIDTLQDKEQKQHSLALTYGTLLNQGDVDENKKPVFVEDPESHRRVPLKSVRQLYQTKVQRAQGMAAIFAAQQRQALASVNGPDASQSAPTQGPPQRAEQTQGPATRTAPTTGSPSSRAPAQQGASVRYSEGGRTYNIPAGLVAEFLRDHPNAQKDANAR